MTGARRKRRSSTSSVETVDERRTQWRQESSVLKTVPKSVDRDDWPTFELRDAVVLNMDGKSLENALHVGTRGPFVVRGHLVIDDPSQKTHLLMRVRGSVPIEIRQCLYYSLAEANGTPVIWVSGKGGWYEINPSPAYRQIYKQMCEATTLYYRLYDIYTERAAKRSKSVKSAAKQELAQVFFQYALQVGDGSTLQSVTDRCLVHAPFFIWHFTQEAPEDFSWESTSFHRWIRHENPDVVDNVNTMLKNPRQLPRSPSNQPQGSSPAAQALPSRARTRSTVSAARDSDLEEISAKDFAPKQQTRTSRSTAQAAPAPVSGNAGQIVVANDQPMADAPADDSAFATVVAALDRAHEKLAGSSKGMTVSATLNHIYFANKFPTYKDGTVGCHRKPVEEALHSTAGALLRHIDKAKYEKHEVYSWLQGLAQTKFSPVALKPSDLPFRVIPRGKQPKKPEADPSGSTGTSSAPAETSTPPRRIGKQPGRTPGKKSALRPVGRPSKRPHTELESDSDAETPAAKKSHYFSGDDDAEVSDEASSPESAAAEETGGPHANEPVKIVIRADKIPSTAPHGRDGTWSCEHEGCDYLVRGSDEGECQARIREHFHEHEEQSSRVNLAVAESRGHLPISHLLEKIKKLGESSQQGEQISVDGIRLPQPIKKKLIV